MTVSSPQKVNQGVTSTASVPGGSGGGGGGGGSWGSDDPIASAPVVPGTENDALNRYLNTYGDSNPPFLTSSAGKLVDGMHKGSPITRGYIRRANPGGSGGMSRFRLNFMYNPSQIVRDFVSYLDQAALDPFNTVYDSGNLVAPPSFINFSFNLLFDRQIEALSDDRGVLVDYDYFDMVVRNVVPGGRSVGSVDNGVMMVNPDDIVVVFSNELSVQGRPVNARVAFTKFDHRMVPTRMEVSLTMIITYFGPVLGGTYNFDYNQDIKTYEALIPYGKIFSEAFTEDDLVKAQKEYTETQEKRLELSKTTEKEVAFGQSFLNAFGSVSGVQGFAGPANGSVAVATLKSAEQRIAAAAGGRAAYSQAARLGPNSYDCSGLVSMAYKDNGIQDLLAGGGATNCAGMYAYGEKTGWTKMNKVLQITPSSGQQLRDMAGSGDVMLRVNTSKSNHVVFVNRWEGDRMVITHASSTAKGCLTESISMSYATQFTHLLRPAAAGGQSAAGGAVLV